MSPSFNNILFSSKPIILAKENIGKCHKYNEYEIKPMPTNILLDKNFINKFLLLPIEIITQVAITGNKVINEGCFVFSSKNIKEKNNIAKDKNKIKLLNFLNITLFLLKTSK